MIKESNMKLNVHCYCSTHHNLEFYFLRLQFFKCRNNFLQVHVCSISCSTDKVDSSTSLCCNTEERMYVLNIFSLEKLCSPLGTETERVKRMLIAINVLTRYQLIFSYSKISLHIAVMCPLQLILQWFAIHCTNRKYQYLSSHHVGNLLL